jgi:hypothetical protein
MRAAIFITIFLYSTFSHLSAQHPLVGTWEMISVKGIDADGKNFFLDTTAIRETKIITPTHYMLIAWDVDQDSLIFNRTMAGMVRMEGEKYIETPTQASVQIFDNLNANFTWRLDGDVFTQSGTIVRPDGKTVVLEALKFRRVKNFKPQQGNPAIGTWHQVSSGDGKINSPLAKADRGLLIVTPTHWMRMNHRNTKFHGAAYGIYSVKGNTVLTNTKYSTYPANKGELSELIATENGRKIAMTSKRMATKDESARLADVFEKVQ